ncbi:MAG: PIG-L family deacetylase [Bacteroidota bacterium]
MNVLLLFAHADDESLGAGGTIPRLLNEGHQLQLITLSEGIIRMRETQDDNLPAYRKACEHLQLDDYQTLGYADQQFDAFPLAELTRGVSQALSFEPDWIITHADTDLNKDHQIVSDIAKIIGRPRKKPVRILGCEIPCGSIWRGNPFPAQFYIDISETLPTKLKAFEQYQNEIHPFPDPFSTEGLETLAKFRGMESGHTAAEAFQVIRWSL